MAAAQMAAGCWSELSPPPKKKNAKPVLLRSTRALLLFFSYFNFIYLFRVCLFLVRP